MPQIETPQIEIPNLYHLSGQHIHVTYSMSSVSGQPLLTYQDTHQSKSFHGDEIRAVECDLGTLVSITLRMTIDMGSTSFSMFMPRMRIVEGTHAALHTYGVTTLHRFSIAPQLNLGQLDTYHIMALHGTAQFVIF